MQESLSCRIRSFAPRPGMPGVHRSYTWRLLATSAAALLLAVTAGCEAMTEATPGTQATKSGGTEGSPGAQRSVTATRPETGTEQVANFGTNPGNLKMYRYAPANLQGMRPLVVALHGCTQHATNYDNESGWTQYADRWGFYLLLPEQQEANNPQLCFNWFKPGDTERTSSGRLQGEALSIAQMIDRMKADYNIDPAQVYITGLSAGGAMTAVMLALQPNVFKGGGIIAGVAYRCADGPIPGTLPNASLANGLMCMSSGRNLTPAEWANRVRRAAPSHYSGPWPIVSIWQGNQDTTVTPSNATELVDQWTGIHGIDQTADIQETIDGYPHQVFADGSGRRLVESYVITGMAHGTPVNPPGSSSADPEKCGVAGPYMLDVGICSSYYIGRFWGLDQQRMAERR